MITISLFYPKLAKVRLGVMLIERQNKTGGVMIGGLSKLRAIEKIAKKNADILIGAKKIY